jgi:pSer/pThr/pTyr-binding forkhead associated (FHA) protein
MSTGLYELTVFETPDEPPKTVELRDGLTAGRTETAEIILLDTLVSRQHLRFCLGPANECVVSDQQSSHGTRVNRKPIQSHSLTDSDVIEVGRVRNKFIDPIEASIVVRVKDTSPSPRSQRPAARPPASSASFTTSRAR